MPINSDLVRTNLEIPDEFHFKTRPLVTAQWQYNATQTEAAWLSYKHCSFEIVRQANKLHSEVDIFPGLFHGRHYRH
jgi:hypothetical protein